MKRIGFSGSRHLTAEQKTIVDEVLSTLNGSEFTTGACIGVDAYIGRKLWYDRPESLHRVVIPADRSRVAEWWLEYEIGDAGPYRAPELEEMPPGTTYRERNWRIIEHSDVLVAFPAYPEDDPRSARSGTWQTIRMARREGLETITVSLHSGAKEAVS